MIWYSKYLQVYNKTFQATSRSIIEEVRGKLSEMNSDSPLVSVVIIAHNEETRILACIWSLCDNSIDFPIEIMAINNNSTDRTVDVLNQTGIRWFNEEKKGPGHARQCGLNHARGKYYLCIDADTLYPPHYIKTHVKELMQPGIACTFGLWSFIPSENQSPTALRLYEFLRDIHLRIQSIKRPELCVRGMNFGFSTDNAKQIGFRTDIKRGEDGSLALSLKEYGKLRFLTTRKVRVFTSNSTLNADGSLTNSYKIRILKAIKNFTGLFKSKSSYKDDESNLIK